MSTPNTVLQQTRQLIHPRHASTVTDAQLLDRFIAEGDEAAFELLVRRHGGMVLSVCQRVLHDEHAAEDAFQATFLTLVRKAAAIGKRESVGSWLYKVAYRIALRLKDRTNQRTRQEKPLGELVLDVCYKPNDEMAWKELRTLLDAEVNRLPEKYRTVFVLCCLEGKTNEQAAEQLGCPKGTVLSRLARARERLRARMAWRGLAFAAVPFASLLNHSALTAAELPAGLVRSLVTGAALVANGQLPTGTVSSTAIELMEGTLRDLSAARRGVLVAVAAITVLLLMGAGTLAYTTKDSLLGPAPSHAAPMAPSPEPSGEGCGAVGGCGGAP